MIGDGGLAPLRVFGSHLDDQAPDPTSTEQVLWEWKSFLDAKKLREPRSVIALTLLGLGLIALGVYFYSLASAPDCTGKICKRGHFSGFIGVVMGGSFLVFPWIVNLPWIGPILCANAERRYSLTEAHFVRHESNRTAIFPLREGRILIKYNTAWFEPLSGPGKRLTPPMRPSEAKRLFAAVAQAREIQRNRGLA